MISITGNLKDIIYVINLSQHSSDPYTIDEFIKSFNNNDLIDHPHDHNWLYITQDYKEHLRILNSNTAINKILKERGVYSSTPYN